MQKIDTQIIGDTFEELCNYYERRGEVMIVSFYHHDGGKRECGGLICSSADDKHFLSAIDMLSTNATQHIKER